MCCDYNKSNCNKATETKQPKQSNRNKATAKKSLSAHDEEAVLPQEEGSADRFPGVHTRMHRTGENRGVGEGQRKKEEDAPGACA